MSGIYKIQSISHPERIYIGSTLYVKKRWRDHLSELRLNKHHSPRLQNHYNKYGESDFVFSIIVECDKEYRVALEQFYIDILNPWFNICKIARGGNGIKWSKERNSLKSGIKNELK